MSEQSELERIRAHWQTNGKIEDTLDSDITWQLKLAIWNNGAATVIEEAILRFHGQNILFFKNQQTHDNYLKRKKINAAWIEQHENRENYAPYTSVELAEMAATRWTLDLKLIYDLIENEAQKKDQSQTDRLIPIWKSAGWVPCLQVVFPMKEKKGFLKSLFT